MDENHDALITEFCGITGADPSTATSALASTNWSLNEAVTFFFASQDQPEEEDDLEDESIPESAPLARTPVAPQAAAPSTSARPPPPNQSRMRTIRDLQSRDPSDDEGEENPDLFAGGEKSGLAVQDPNNRNNPSDHFNNIIQRAQQNRPRPGGDDEDENASAGPSFFSGRGQTLGGDDEPSRVIEDPVAAAAAAAARPSGLPRVSRVLHLWQDGFSIDDGPLYRFDDPANAHTLALINQGRAPLELLDVRPGQEVDLSLNPHKDEKFVQPKRKYKPFEGGGQRLGSPTPGPSSSTTSQSAQPVAASTASSSSTAPSAVRDESQPTITLQIRLGDGSRLSSRFNTTQTIGDVYGFVNASSAASSSRAYVLMTTFPSKELSDKDAVLGDLAEFKRGGVVVQKWT